MNSQRAIALKPAKQREFPPLNRSEGDFRDASLLSGNLAIAEAYNSMLIVLELVLLLFCEIA